MLSFNIDTSKGETPASVARKRAIVQALMAAQGAPRNIGEGLNALGDGIVSNVLNRRADAAEQTGQAHAADIFGGLTNAGIFPAAPGGALAATVPRAAADGSSPASPVAGGTNYRDAIAGIESAGSGDYAAVGPTSKTLGRALGRYQVMEANIGPWSREALGREVTPKEFLADPKIQDAVFDHQFGKYVQKYGNPQDAASAWFTGGPLSSGAHKKDVLGTTGAAYVDKFTRGLGAPAVAANEALAAGQPIQVASLDPSAGMPAADPYGRLPATDSRGEDQRAKFRQWNSNPAANEAANAAAIDPALAGVIERAKQIAGTDFVIGSGRRDAATQQKAVDWGWSKTKESDHLGGGAADLWPVDANGQVIFDPQKQATIVQAMKQAAQEKGVDIEAGADWSKFQDKPHFGMVGQTPLDNAPIPQARPDIRGAPIQVASADPSIGMPAAAGGEVGGLGSPVNQRALSTLMDKQPIGGQGAVVQALSAANPPAQAPAAPSPVVEALSAAQQPQQAAPASPGVQQVARAMQPQTGKPQGPGRPGEIRQGSDGKNYQYAQTTGMAGATGDQGWIETSMPAQGGGADNLPVMAGGSSDAIQPGQAGPTIQQLMQAAADPWVSPEQKAMIGSMLQQKMQEADPLRQLQIQAARKSLAVPPKQWQKLDDNTLFDPASGETKQIGEPGSAPLFKGSSVDAQSLNWLVQNGKLTPEQAAQIGAGKSAIDPSTGAMIFMTPSGIVSQMPGQAPQPVAPQPAPGDQSAVPAAPPANTGMIPLTGPKQANDGERNAMTFADRMTQSGKLIDNLGNAGLSNWDQSVRGNSWIPDIVENQIVGGDFQKFDQARRDFINAQLRRESGAVISPEEFDNANKQYFPYPGDSKETLEQKRKNRETVINGMVRAAGPTYKPAAASDLPDGVTEEDVQHTMKLHGMTRQQVLEQINGS